MLPPKVSVLLPAYNCAQHLSEAIESVLVQTLTEFELLILLDTSTDSTAELAARFANQDSRVRIVPNTSNQGLVGALNLGIEEAKGQYIARMDSDDISMPERFRRQVDFLDSHTDIVLCGTWVRLFGLHEGIEWKLATQHDEIQATMLFYGALCHPAVMYRRDFFIKHGIRYDYGYKNCEDYELWTRLAELGRLANVPEFLLRYRTHHSNLGTIRRKAILHDTSRVRERLIEKLGIHPSPAELALHNRIGNWEQIKNDQQLLTARRWIEKLEEGNEKTGYFERNAFKAFLNRKRQDLETLVQQGSQRSFVRQVLRKTFQALVPAEKREETKEKLILAKQQLSSFPEKVCSRLRLSTQLQNRLSRHPIRIGIAVLAHERPDYLAHCLETLFKTKLDQSYEVTFLLHDDGSKDPRVAEIINQPRDPRYRIVRRFSPKGPNNAGAAINKAVKALLELGDFDIIGWSDPDAVYHPDWLTEMLKICLWAKESHRDHVLGPFSCFNSSDYKYHRVLGTFDSPYGKYVVKRQMGMLNYFYFKEDFLKLGYFPENPDDETLMTERFEKLKVRNFCTYESFSEHIGHHSTLNQWRPKAVPRSVHGMNLRAGAWGVDLERLSPYAYCRYLKAPQTFGPDIRASNLKINLMIPAVAKDLMTLPKVVQSARSQIRHPIQSIFIVGPDLPELRKMAQGLECTFLPESEISPISLSKIDIRPQGLNRSGWFLQQFLKLSVDQYSPGVSHTLVIDADLVFTAPQRFDHNGKQILLVSDEFHPPYYDIYFRLLKARIDPQVSFVAHHMLLDHAVLQELRAEIEKSQGMHWCEAILKQVDRNEISSFSEYETYGNFLRLKDPGIPIEYWHNRSFCRKDLRRLNKLVLEDKGRSRSFSFHSYN